jgi:hypothetical protein
VVGLPLQDRLEKLRQYPWSSFVRYRTGKGCEFVDENPILELAGGRAALIRFTEEGVSTKDTEFIEVYRASRFGIGRDDFLLEMRDMYRAVRKRRKTEDLSLRREGRWVPTDQIVGEVCKAFGARNGDERVRRRDHDLRPAVSWMLSKYGGLTQRDIAERIGAGTGRAVCGQLKMFRDALANRPSLVKTVAKLELTLTKAQHDIKL